MATKVFINLPVKDLDRTMTFFTGLGFTFNPQFSDDKAACMGVSDSIFVMMLTEEYFKTFTRKDVCDARKATEVLIALDAESKEEVERLVAQAGALGATVYADPQDYGWMYQHSFADLDGHQWELVYMDMNKMPGQD